MVVLEDFQLVLAHIVFDGVGTEIRPPGEIVEPFALVLGRLDGLTQLLSSDTHARRCRIRANVTAWRLGAAMSIMLAASRLLPSSAHCLIFTRGMDLSSPAWHDSPVYWS